MRRSRSSAPATGNTRDTRSKEGTYEQRHRRRPPHAGHPHAQAVRREPVHDRDHDEDRDQTSGPHAPRHAPRQDDGNPVTDLLPDRYLDRYDREFLYRMLGAAIRLRARLADPTANHAAHSVIEEILISRAIRLIADDDNEEGSGLEAWLEDWLGDLDIDRLYDPAADEATLASNPATGSGDMRFDHWFEDQYWADETDGGE